ncbi:hypothetical protein F5B20DRAFT_525935 [Whalleya microplaca]|nr:hypothetical protein F5B20DRAFT_525935 [Whalleya microplaca]
MMYELSRPPTQNGGGSRPPTSRFQEGSMNDRVSATPPVQFLGPDQLRNYEKQFYAEPQSPQESSRKHRRERPHSAAAKMQSGSRHPEQSDDDELHQQQQRFVSRKKSHSGFFSRVRDKLGFSSRSSNSSNSSSSSNNSNIQQKQDSARKHSSLQEPLRSPPPPPAHSPRRDHLRAQSETYVAQLPNLKSGTDRPSREDVLASYNELMANGFFQSHAIQSTRHTRPQGARPTAPLPTIPSLPCSPVPPRRTSSINAIAASPTAKSPAKSPAPTSGRAHRQTSRPPHTRDNHNNNRNNRSSKSLSPEPYLQPQASRHTLRGRKRSRVDMEDAASPPIPSIEPPQSPTRGASASAAPSSFAEPLKRVAKKLRKTPTPSSPPPPSRSPPPPPPTQTTHARSSPAPPNPMASDGVLRLVPSVPSLQHRYREKAVRMRSPSPAAPGVVARRQRSQNRQNQQNQNQQTQQQQSQQQQGQLRRVFSGSGGAGNRLRKRAKSASPRKASAVEIWERSAALGGGERMSVDSIRVAPDADEDTDTDMGMAESAAGVVDGFLAQTQAQQPLSVVPDANRGIPSVPRIPDQYHYYQKYRRQTRSQTRAASRGVVDENAGGRMEVDWRYGEAL